MPFIRFAIFILSNDVTAAPFRFHWFKIRSCVSISCLIDDASEKRYLLLFEQLTDPDIVATSCLIFSALTQSTIFKQNVVTKWSDTSLMHAVRWRQQLSSVAIVLNENDFAFLRLNRSFSVLFYTNETIVTVVRGPNTTPWQFSRWIIREMSKNNSVHFFFHLRMDWRQRSPSHTLFFYTLCKTSQIFFSEILFLQSMCQAYAIFLCLSHRRFLAIHPTELLLDHWNSDSLTFSSDSQNVRYTTSDESERCCCADRAKWSFLSQNERWFIRVL